MKNIEKEIKENWFGEHVANYKKINDEISILDWKKPDTICFGVRYVFDGRHLYISGDLGEAVFTLTWNGNPKSFSDINPHYFHEKLTAYRGNDEYDFDSNEASSRLEEEINILNDEYLLNEIEKGHIEVLEEMKELADDCSSNKEWENKIAYETCLFDRLSNYDSGCWEWIFRVGEVIPSRIKSYLIGLKMAAKQLGGQNE